MNMTCMWCQTRLEETLAKLLDFSPTIVAEILDWRTAIGSRFDDAGKMGAEGSWVRLAEPANWGWSPCHCIEKCETFVSTLCLMIFQNNACKSLISAWLDFGFQIWLLWGLVTVHQTPSASAMKAEDIMTIVQWELAVLSRCSLTTASIHPLSLLLLLGVSILMLLNFYPPLVS